MACSAATYFSSTRWTWINVESLNACIIVRTTFFTVLLVSIDLEKGYYCNKVHSFFHSYTRDCFHSSKIVKLCLCLTVFVKAGPAISCSWYALVNSGLEDLVWLTLSTYSYASKALNTFTSFGVETPVGL